MRYHEDGCNVHPVNYAEGVRTVWILEGTDPQKATRKLHVVRVRLRSMDGIGFRLFGNLENQSAIRSVSGMLR